MVHGRYVMRWPALSLTRPAILLLVVVTLSAACGPFSRDGVTPPGRPPGPATGTADARGSTSPDAVVLPEVVPPRTGAAASGDAAVVVGVGTYLILPPATYAERDAQLFHRWLVDTRGVSDERVTSLRTDLFETRPTREAILKALAERANEVSGDGILWLYFAGHGGLKSDGGLLLLGDDTGGSQSSREERSVSREEIIRLAHLAGVRRLVVVTDACFSGVGRTGEAVAEEGRLFMAPAYDPTTSEMAAASDREARGVASGTKMKVVLWAAAGPDRLAKPLHPVQHGRFTYFAVGALSGWAGSQEIRLGEAQAYTQRALASLASHSPDRQEPVQWSVLWPAADARAVIVRETEPALATVMQPPIGPDLRRLGIYGYRSRESRPQGPRFLLSSVVNVPEVARKAWDALSEGKVEQAMAAFREGITAAQDDQDGAPFHERARAQRALVSVAFRIEDLLREREGVAGLEPLIVLYQELLEAFPGLAVRGEVSLRLARCLKDSGRLAEAAASYEQALHSIVEDLSRAEVLVEQGDVLQSIGNESDADASFQSAVDLVSKVRASEEDWRTVNEQVLRLAGLLGEAGRFEQALGVVSKVLEQACDGAQRAPSAVPLCYEAADMLVDTVVDGEDARAWETVRDALYHWLTEAETERLLVEMVGRLVERNKYLEAMSLHRDLSSSTCVLSTAYDECIRAADIPNYYSIFLKVARMYFSAGKADESIKMFEIIVSSASMWDAEGGFFLLGQVVNDMVVVYAAMEDDDAWKRAREYFLSIFSEETTYKLLARMADLVQEADKHEVAITMYRHFIERDPNDPRVSEFYDRVYTSLKDLHDDVAIESFVNEVFTVFDPEGTWMTVNKDSGEAVAIAQTVDQTGLMWTSNYLHRRAEEARETLDASMDYASAARYYRMFADRHPNAKKAYLVNFYYAEILYDQLHDYEEAARQYQAVIEKNKKGMYVEDAALGVIYCTEKLLIEAGLLEEGPKKGGIMLKRQKLVKDLEEEIEVTPLAPQEKRYVDAADQYVSIMTGFINDPGLKRKYPKKGEKIPEIMFIAAQTFYRHGMFLDAVKRLQTIFAYNPKHKYASHAVFTLLHCYIRLHRWEQVEQWTRKLIAEKNFTVMKKPDLQKIVAISMTEQAKDFVLKRKYRKAEKKLKGILREFGRDKKLASKVTFNLAALYERSRQLKKAVETYEKVFKEFPKSSSAPLAVFVTADLYESQTMYERAARYFEKMERFKEHELAPVGLANAGAIWEALERYDDAIKVYRRYVTLFSGKVDNRPTVELHIGKLYEAKDTLADDRKAISEYEEFARKHRTGARVVEAWSRMGALLVEAGKERNKRTILKVFENAMGAFARLEAKEITPAAKYFAAQAAFLSTEYLFDEFQAVKIMAISTWKLEKVLTSKVELHQKLKKTYQTILDYKSPHWNAACLFRIGLLYYDCARTLLDAPIPDGLTFDQEDEYHYAMEQVAGPIEEKSLKAFEYALRRANEEQTYNEWSRKSSEFAAMVNPDLFPLQEEKLVTADKLSDPILATDIRRVLERGGKIVDFLYRD
jgi:cellulose synthase operon protein C